MLPVEQVPPHRVPGHSVGEADGLGDGEEHLRHHHLRRLGVVATDLIHSERDRLVLARVLALDRFHRDAVDEEHHVLARAVLAVVGVKLLRHLVHIAPLLARAGEVAVINQRQVELAVFLRAEKFVLIAQCLQEIAVAVDVSVETLELADQRALGLLVFRVEGADLAVQQVAEVERRRARPLLRRRSGRVEAASPLGLGAWHVGPADLLCVVQDAGLDSFVFAARRHRLNFPAMPAVLAAKR